MLINKFTSPLGTAVEVDLVPRRRAWGRSPGIRATIAWRKGSAEALEMWEQLAFFAHHALGPDGPMLLAAGELWSPLRDGDLEHPGDPRFAGAVFAEITGHRAFHVVDARPGGNGECFSYPDPEVDPIFGPGSGLRLSSRFVLCDGFPLLELLGGIAVCRGAPGWETWLTEMMARKGSA